MQAIPHILQTKMVDIEKEPVWEKAQFQHPQSCTQRLEDQDHLK